MAGPGDATSVLRSIAGSRIDDGIAHVAYARQVFEMCIDRGIPAFSYCINPRRDDFSFECVRSVNCGDPLAGKRWLSYHWGNVQFARQIEKLAAEFGATILITATEPYPFLLEGLARKGVHVIPALNALMLPAFGTPSVAVRVATRMSRRFLQSVCPAILSHPGVGVRQVHELADSRPRPVVEFLPLYDHRVFAGSEPPSASAKEFRVITVGRCEEFKGAFDLVEIAKRALRISGRPLRFDWCGAGAALEEARRRVIAEGLSASVTFHGWTEMAELQQLWSQSHLCVVPTTSRFVEGFNQVVVESVISGRPVVTSAVCPSLDFVRPCAVEVEVDSIDGYVDAIVSLANSSSRYDDLRSSCARLTPQFFDPRKSFRAAIEHIIDDLHELGHVRPLAHPPGA